MYCGDIEESACREQHGYTSERKLNNIHHLHKRRERERGKVSSIIYSELPLTLYGGLLKSDHLNIIEVRQDPRVAGVGTLGWVQDVEGVHRVVAGLVRVHCT